MRIWLAVCVHGGTTFECLNGVIDIWTIFVRGRLPRVLIFLLSPFSPTSLPQRQLRRDFPVSGKDEDVCGYVNGWSCDAYKIWPNCWFFPYLIYRAAIRLLLDLRSKRSIRRFIIRNYSWENCQKKFFLVSSLSKSSPPSSLDSSKILSHVSRYFIYI